MSYGNSYYGTPDVSEQLHNTRYQAELKSLQINVDINRVVGIITVNHVK